MKLEHKPYSQGFKLTISKSTYKVTKEWFITAENMIQADIISRRFTVSPAITKISKVRD